MLDVDFTTVTETPGTLVSTEALDMAWTRYALAAEHCVGKSVLEVACGPGPGLGYLAERASTVVGGDCMAAHLAQVRAHYGSHVPLVRLDAQHLPFRRGSFDVVILFEALYFLKAFDAFVQGCWDLLPDRGALLIATVNPQWADFNQAPFSTKYLTAEELHESLNTSGFAVDIYGGFPIAEPSVRDRVMSIAKRITVKLHLIPRTMKGKQLLKRVAFGKLGRFPPEISCATGTFRAPTRLSDLRAVEGYKVLYAVARKETR